MTNRIILLLCTLFLFQHSEIDAQDYTWWNTLVDWDGSTSWYKYLQLSTSGLGPNALPVPEFHSLAIGDDIVFDNKFQFHYNPGDQTKNWLTSIEIPFAKKVAIRAWMAPVEHFRTDTKTRNDRKIRVYDAKGYASSDLFFGTYVQILEESLSRPYVLFSANFKTASGRNIEAGRVTETPAYYFDLLLAKSIELTDDLDIRPYAAAGLYVYQTYDGLHFQNDAFLYALGCHLQTINHNLQLEWAGYSGYLNIGDQPSVFRINYYSNLSSKMNGTLSFQSGLRDFPYTSFSLGFQYLLSRKAEP